MARAVRHALMGSCKWEIPADIVGTLIVVIADYGTWKHKFGMDKKQ